MPEPDGSEVYSNGQYLTLNRFNMKTREGRVIRPWENPLGEAPKLSTWALPKPLLGVATRAPGLPKSSWIAGLEASRRTAGTIYLVADNHRNGDDANCETAVQAQARIAFVYSDVSASTGVPTVDQQAPITALAKCVAELPAKARSW